MTDPSSIISRLKETVREFWLHKQDKFGEVWKVLDKDGKTKFANAAVAACQKMTPQADVLLPEVTVDSLVNDSESVIRLFWYYNTDDGFERDEELVKSLESTGELKHSHEQALALRQIAILQVLTRLIDVFDSIWNKGVEGKRQPEKDIIAETLKVMNQSFSTNTCMYCKQEGKSLCSRCEQVKYCSRECQKKHWKEHKQFCTTKEKQEIDKREDLQKKLRTAKTKAKDKTYDNSNLFHGRPT